MNIKLNDTVKIGVKLLNKDAKPPVFKTEESAGFDIYTTDEDTTVKAGETVKIGTGLAFAIPKGYQIEVRSRSGISLKTKLRVSNAPGTIDSDYTGEANIIIDNIGSEDIVVEKGTRLAQGVLGRVIPSEFELVESLEETKRGSNGFGHSGLK